ncbi:MAG TPA: serine protease, partial [Cryomorphaceae bacterium]|nr:serine protease [Cryomorphaceae bacterium]
YGMEWFSLMSKLQRAKSEVDMDVALVEFHQNYSRTVSEKTTAAMLSMAFETFPELLGDMDEAAIIGKVHNEVDALIELAIKDQPIDIEMVAPTANNFSKAAFQSFYAVSPDNALLQKATELSSEYMRALIEVFPEHNFYPDANSTLRVAYGKLEGVSPRDAVSYGTTTYLDGAMAKYKPGDYEFDMPAKLIESYDNKDYGQYSENGKLPVCNIASNHTTGGNSGSPVLNARGELIGLNFDRIWEGTMSDVNFDPNICRNIMVDSRYVLFIIDKFAGQQWLIDEMDLVSL